MRLRTVRHLLASTIVACGISTAASLGDPISSGDVVIKLETVATGLTAPIYATHASDGSGRLFIVEQSGQIRILHNGVVLPTPFLDIADKLPELGMFFDERGLLGLAFHPDYANNGRFFVRYSAPREGQPDEPCNQGGLIQGCHSEILAEYSVSADNADVADPDSESILFSVEEPQFNHDGGTVAFGPDGLLYFALGDGGGANDGLADDPPSHGPIGNGQNINTALGTMLRIDVDSPPDPGLAYAIPPDNPFVGQDGLDEIYAYGFRNPYRFSFDDGSGGTGDLYLGDVGQNLFEEVNIVTLGGNYGWVIKEGLHCFDPFDPLMPPADCPDVGPLGEPLVDPIAEYAHPGFGFDPEGGITVVGGFVYRGMRSPSLLSTYVFGDFAQAFMNPSGSLYLLTADGIRQFQIGADDEPYGLFLKGFGEDENGEVYACGSSALAPYGEGGVVQRIVVVPSPSLFFKQGACPAPLNVHSQGVFPVVLTGTPELHVQDIDLASLQLSRVGMGEGFEADMNGDQENPAVMSDASGHAELALSADESTLSYTIHIDGLDLDGNQTPDPDDDVLGMHIHNAPAGVNGPVVFGMISPGQDPDIVIDPVAGLVSGTWDAADPSNQALVDMLDELRSGELYINVHTPPHPSGEIRGQISALPSGVAPLNGPPGPGIRIADLNHTANGHGEDCVCNDNQSSDGIDDLVMRFSTSELVNVLALDNLAPGEIVQLELSGNLFAAEHNGLTVFNFALSPDNEVPPVDSPAGGECTVILDQDCGDVTVSCSYEGLVGTATAAHIHGLAPAGENAGVIVPLTVSGGSSGTVVGGGTLTMNQVTGMLTGLTYVNVHSDEHSPGEIRGQVAGGGTFSASNCIQPVPAGGSENASGQGAIPRMATSTE